MTLQELLQKHGVEPEAVTKIVADMKENKIFTAAEENLDTRYAKLKEDYTNLTSQHSESTKLIEQLKKMLLEMLKRRERLLNMKSRLHPYRHSLKMLRLRQQQQMLCEMQVQLILIMLCLSCVKRASWSGMTTGISRVLQI